MANAIPPCVCLKQQISTVVCRHVYRSNTFTRLSRKVHIFAATMYWLKRVAWNEIHRGLGCM